MDLEIADSDGQYPSGLQKLGHLQPGACVAARNWPVDQVKIQVIQLQSLKASVKSSVHIPETLCIVPDLACDEKILAGNAASGNGLANAFLVLVGGCSVNQAVSCVHCCIYGCLCFIVCCLIYSKPEKGHFSVVIQEYGFSQS